MQPALDPAAMALLKKAEQSLFGLKTYRAECWTTLLPDPEPGKSPRPPKHLLAILTAAKPAFLRYDQWSLVQSGNTWKRKSDAPNITYVCDGKDTWQQYDTTCTKKKGRHLDTGEGSWGFFYSTDMSPLNLVNLSREDGSLRELRREGKETIEGVLCDKVVVKVNQNNEEIAITWYFSSEGLVRREFMKLRGFTSDAVLRNIQVNTPIPSRSKVFSYQLPRGVTLKKEITPLPLLKRGSIAPDFTATDKNGKTFKLSDLRGEVVLLSFWNSEDVACIVQMLSNQALMKWCQDRKYPVVFLALDDSESRDTFLKWVNKNPEYDSLLFAHSDPKAGISKSYKVSVVPTVYVIDRQGIIKVGDFEPDTRMFAWYIVIAGVLENKVK